MGHRRNLSLASFSLDNYQIQLDFLTTMIHFSVLCRHVAGGCRPPTCASMVSVFLDDLDCGRLYILLQMNMRILFRFASIDRSIDRRYLRDPTVSTGATRSSRRNTCKSGRSYVCQNNSRKQVSIDISGSSGGDCCSCRKN